MKFLHVSPEQMLLDSFKLGRTVYEQGFRPKHAISIWRGGTPVGLGVSAYFRSRGIQISHTSIATESYTGIGNSAEVIIKGLEHLVRIVCPEDSLLIIDDVYERGETVGTVIEALRGRARANAPSDIRVATIHRKPGKVTWEGVPVICLEDVDDDVWIDYPHELADMVTEDPEDPLIMDKDPEIHALLRQDYFEPVEEDLGGSYRYIQPRELMMDSIRLGINIFRDSDFVPDYLIALWPGGIEAGLPVHEVYKYLAKKEGKGRKLPDHISINTIPTYKSYQTDFIGLDYLVDRINTSDKILIIDSTFKSGSHVNTAIAKLKEHLRRNLNHKNVRVASLYWNTDDRSTWTTRPEFKQPHYYLKKTNRPIIYPFSIHRLASPHKELAQLNPALHRLLFAG